MAAELTLYVMIVGRWLNTAAFAKCIIVIVGFYGVNMTQQFDGSMSDETCNWFVH